MAAADRLAPTAPFAADVVVRVVVNVWAGLLSTIGTEPSECDIPACLARSESRDDTLRAWCTLLAKAPARHGFTGRVVIVPDPDRLDDVVSGLLRAAIDVREFDCVCSENETGIVPAAILAAAYGRAGLPVATAVALRDKVIQNRRIRAAGIPVAEQVATGSELHVDGGTTAV